MVFAFHLGLEVGIIRADNKESAFVQPSNEHYLSAFDYLHREGLWVETCIIELAGIELLFVFVSADSRELSLALDATLEGDLRLGLR